MNYITILTPDNIEIEYRLAGPGSRLAAFAIDAGLQAAFLFLVALGLFFSVLSGDIKNINTQELAPWIISGLIILVFVVLFGYYIIMEVIEGRTIGKRLLGLRVLKDNGAAISLWQSAARNLIKLFIDAAGIGIIIIMFSKKHKRLGDMAAMTIVISEHPNKYYISTLPQTDTPFHTQTESPYKLSDKEYRLLKDFFDRLPTFTDGGDKCLSYITRYFAKKFAADPETFTKKVLREMVEM